MATSYSVGTVNITNGTAAVTGILTGWVGQVLEGDLITFDNGAKVYEINANPASNTSLTLAKNFAEATITGGTYTIFRVSPRHTQSGTMAALLKDTLERSTRLLFGTTDPSSLIGVDGDVYIKHDVAGIPLMFFGRKVAGSWPSGVTVTGGTPIGPNLLINGDMQINQRAFAGGALSPNTFGYDRWRSDAASTANFAASGFTITYNSGMMCQVIEPPVWGYANLASQPITVSVGDPSHDMTVYVGANSGTIVAGAGRRSVTITPGAGETGNLTVRLHKATAGSMTLNRIKAEVGNAATPWVARDIQRERQLCARYFQAFAHANVNGLQAIIPGTVWSGAWAGVLTLHEPMRTGPTLAISALADFAISIPGTFFSTPTSMVLTDVNSLGPLGPRHLTVTCTYSGSSSGAGYLAPANANARFTLSAEL